jgi:cobalt/nickel transport system ATP-binding protein
MALILSESSPTTPSPAPAIRLEGLRHRYPDGVEALRGVDLEVPAGQRVALVGPNGAGKTTLLLHLNGLLKATQGRVWVSGIEVRPATYADVRRRIGYVFQDPDDQLFSPTVFEDVAFGPLHLELAPGDVAARVQRALDEVGLSGFQGRVPQRLSAGEKRLVALATVLSYQPETLVFDEPSAALDPGNRRQLLRLLARLPSTQIVATHDLDLAWELCDRTILLTGGHVHADGPTRAILADRKLLEANGLELPLRLQLETSETTA